ncbi:hypothetical protein BX600DRAFT_428592 [Xylariales sp. PMI_506]|nr:hypothetical protein BX600DRAFT_428592 [Xylariales sp. PMI_506]
MGPFTPISQKEVEKKAKMPPKRNNVTRRSSTAATATSKKSTTIDGNGTVYHADSLVAQAAAFANDLKARFAVGAIDYTFRFRTLSSAAVDAEQQLAEQGGGGGGGGGGDDDPEKFGNQDGNKKLEGGKGDGKGYKDAPRRRRPIRKRVADEAQPGDEPVQKKIRAPVQVKSAVKKGQKASLRPVTKMLLRSPSPPQTQQEAGVKEESQAGGDDVPEDGSHHDDQGLTQPPAKAEETKPEEVEVYVKQEPED